MSDSTIPSIQQPAIQTTSTSTNSTTPKVAIRNWKTTTIGFVLCCSGFVAFSPSTFGGEQAPLVQVCKYITSGGLAALGITAKDSNVTSKNQE
jgi:hypothetical protein